MRQNTDGDEDDRPSYLPPGEYYPDVVFERALERHDWACAACEESLNSGGVHEHIWYNDFSDRSAVPLCNACARRDDWREDVRERRLEDAGRARGWVITKLWDYPTAEIRYASQLLGEAILGILVTAFLATTGWLDTAADFINAMPLVAAAGVALVYLAHHAVWTRRDPRGYVPCEHGRAWHHVLFAVLTGTFGIVAGLIVTEPLLAAVSWVTAAASLLLAAHMMESAVRADRSDARTEIDRSATAGVVRALAILGIAALIIQPGPLVMAVLAALPLAASAAYLVYRYPEDYTLRRQLRTLSNELHDLLYGGPY